MAGFNEALVHAAAGPIDCHGRPQRSRTVLAGMRREFSDFERALGRGVDGRAGFSRIPKI